MKSPVTASARLLAVQSPIIPVVGELIARHPGTISLGQGVVHYAPPQRAIDELQVFLADPQNHKYKLVDGIRPLVELLEKKLAAENGITLAPRSRVVVTAGGNMAFFNALLAIADPGDEIILPTPYYFNHEMAITMLNCRPVLVPTLADYQLDVAALAAAITERTRAIVTTSPNNPTGAVAKPETLRQINQLCRDRGIYHISDEAYEYFVYDGAEHFSPGSIAGSAEHTISLYSLSKAYGFASWRIGYMVIPEHLAVAVKKAQDTILICPPVISQVAACGALREDVDWLRVKIASLAAVRQLVLNELEAVRGFCQVSVSRGAFYFLLDVDTPLSAMAVVERLIREFGVAVIPGTTFGIERGSTFRVAYGALDRDSVAEGIGRLVKGLTHIARCSS